MLSPSSSIRDSVLGVRRSAFSPLCCRFLLSIVITQTLLLVALAISLCWNVREAADASARVQAAYLVGVDDGAAMLRARIIRSILERQIIEENNLQSGSDQPAAQKEKL